MNWCLSLGWRVGPLNTSHYATGNTKMWKIPVKFAKIKIHMNKSVRKFTMFVLEEWNILCSATKNKILCDSLCFHLFLSSMP